MYCLFIQCAGGLVHGKERSVGEVTMPINYQSNVFVMMSVLSVTGKSNLYGYFNRRLLFIETIVGMCLYLCT